MQRKHILVLESEKLLAAGIYSLLTSRPEFDVTSMTLSALAGLEQCGSLEPDVIILDQDLLPAHVSTIMQLVSHHSNSRLIFFGLGDNQLRVFDKHIVQIEQTNDFFNLLNNSPGAS